MLILLQTSLASYSAWVLLVNGASSLAIRRSICIESAESSELLKYL